MSHYALTRASSDPLLLGLLGLGAAGLLALASVAREPRTALPGGPAAAPAADPGEGLAPALLSTSSAREPVLACASLGPERDDGTVKARTGVCGARKEREFLAGFLALEHARPGALAERAEAVLASDGPAAEKVALLRALGESGSKEHLRWLEHAVRTLPDDSGPHGVSVARFALGELDAAEREDREARMVLGRLAFRTPGLSPGLRRSAATSLARKSDDAEIEGLRVALARESDELLMAGVLAVLRERPESPRAVRLAEEFTPAMSRE